MKRSIPANKKRRGPGRPATGHNPTVAVRLPQQVIDAVDKWAKKNGVAGRSEAFRRLVEAGLAGEAQHA